MELMRKFMICAAALAALTTGALASDLPTKYQAQGAIIPLAPLWTGFYIGVNGGMGYSTQDQSIAGVDKAGIAAVASGFVPGTVATRGWGGMFGGTVGYNYQLNPMFVLGVETDFDWADIGGSGGQSLTLGPFALNTTGSEKLNWVGTLRARGGWLVTPSTLLYATGGLAYGAAESATNITLTIPKTTYTAAADTTSTKVGWVVGAGVEQKFWVNWSVKAEYDYIDLGSIGNSFGTALGTKNPIPVNFTSNQDLRYQTVKVGLNYHF
jgi:outer membrane immunogenic protein